MPSFLYASGSLRLLGGMFPAGNRALKILGPFFLVTADSLSQKQFAELGNTPFLSLPDVLKKLLEARIDSNTQKNLSCHARMIVDETMVLQAGNT